MKRIEPDSIPELRIMPWAIAIIIALGTGYGGNRKAVGPDDLGRGLSWLLAIAGLVDFWLWEYDYGHNLDLEHCGHKGPGHVVPAPTDREQAAPELQGAFVARCRWLDCVHASLFAGVCGSGGRVVRPGRRPTQTSGSLLLLYSRLGFDRSVGLQPRTRALPFEGDLGVHCRMPIVDMTGMPPKS